MRERIARRRRTGKALGVVAVVAALGVAIPGFANLPNSTFDAGDGNLILDDEAKDWVNAPNFAKRIDLLKGQGDDAMGNGTSEDTEVPSLVTDGIPPNKSDITRFYVGSETISSPLKNFLYVAWERITDPSGTTNFDFELNQSTTLTSNNVTPVRTAGDVLIKYDLANGGTNPVLGYHIWVTAQSAPSGATASSVCEANSKFPCWDKVHTISGTNFEAEINTQEVTDPIDPEGGPNPATPGSDPLSRLLPARTFGEAAIDLIGSGILQPGSCAPFASAYLKSRSSDAFNSAIKDFAAPVGINIDNCGELRVNKYIDIDESGTQSLTGNESTLMPLGGVVSPDLSGWSITVTGPNSFSCTGTTNSSGVLASCGTADLTSLPPGTYTVQENANAGKTIGNNAAPFFNTDPGPAPATPPVSEQVVIGLAGVSSVNLGNSCYAKAKFEVQSVPSGQSGLFVRYKVNGGTALDVALTKDGATSTYKASVGSLRKGDVITWSYGINQGLANEQTKAVPGSFTLSGYPSCETTGTVTFTNTTINGSKFKDVNGNGVKDPNADPLLNDGPLQGFQFELRAGSTGTGSVVGTSQKSAANGTFSFQNVPPGDYTIHEINRPSGWLQTTPASNGYVSVTVNLGDATVTANPFGNTPLSKIQVNFLPQAKLLNADGTESSTNATKATSISCTDPADPTAESVGSSTNSNTLTTGNVQLKQSSVTCVVTFVDP